MANSLTNIYDKILAAGLSTLREAAVMPRLVTPDYESAAAQKGATVDIPVPVAQAASDVTASNTLVSAQDHSPGLVQLQLNRWRKSDFYLTDKEMAEVDRNRHFVPMQTSEAARALANDVDGNIHAEYKKVSGYEATNAIPFSTVATITNARKVLNQQLAPMSRRNVVIDPTAEAQALQLAAYRDISQAGDRAVPIEGEIGRKFGFDHFMSQNVVTHTAGTLASGVVASTKAAGASAIDLKVGSSAGGGTTLVYGDIFTIAGQTQTYVVRTSATVTFASALTAQSVSISPALAAAATANAKITRKATHVVNLAFHPGWCAFASRPLMSATNQTIQRMMTDPVSGISMRLEISRQNKRDVWEFDILYGAKNIRPEYATRIAG